MWVNLGQLLLGPAASAAKQVLDFDARLVLTPRFGGFEIIGAALSAQSLTRISDRRLHVGSPGSNGTTPAG